MQYKNTEINYCKNTQLVTCGAFVQLGQLHQFLDKINRRIPLDFSAQSATIGGIASTGAGGQESRAASIIDSIKVICGDKIIREFSLNEKEELIQNNQLIDDVNLSLQGTIGLITEIKIKTMPKFIQSYSAMVEVPIKKIFEFQQLIVKNSPVVACEIIDHRSMENVTNKQYKSDHMTCLIQWGSHLPFDLGSIFEKLVEKFPDIIESMEISSSEKQEKDLWRIRHDVSDSNRKWAKKNGYEYKGYDLKFPINRLDHIIAIFNTQISERGGTLFPFGHTMQHNGYVTMHVNFAMPENIPPDLIRSIIVQYLWNEDVTMAAEHGDMGHKSVNDYLKTTSSKKIKKIINFWLSCDPNSVFRDDIKSIVIESNLENSLLGIH